MSWHFLQGQEAESWEENSLDGAPYALLRLMPMPAESCSPASGTESLNHSQSGMTCEHSTATPGADTLTLSAADFPARTFPQVGVGLDLRVNAPGSGERWPASWVKFDPDTCSWKTLQCSLLGDSEEFLGTWPKWGIGSPGGCSALTTPDFPTVENESGSWPTPKARDWRSGGTNPAGVQARIDRRKNQGVIDLPDAACLRLWRPGLTGLLNPSFSEKLMGWPSGWTDLKPLETAKFRQWQHSHGAHLCSA